MWILYIKTLFPYLRESAYTFLKTLKNTLFTELLVIFLMLETLTSKHVMLSKDSPVYHWKVVSGP